MRLSSRAADLGPRLTAERAGAELLVADMLVLTRFLLTGWEGRDAHDENSVGRVLQLTCSWRCAAAGAESCRRLKCCPSLGHWPKHSLWAPVADQASGQSGMRQCQSAAEQLAQRAPHRGSLRDVHAAGVTCIIAAYRQQGMPWQVMQVEAEAARAGLGG